MTMTTCDKCRRTVPTEDTEVGEVRVGRQTHREPAEYEDQTWCFDCINEAKRDAEMDDFDRAYERARARGWED